MTRPPSTSGVCTRRPRRLRTARTLNLRVPRSVMWVDDHEEQPPGLTYHWGRVDTDLGALVYGVDPDELERRRAHL